MCFPPREHEIYLPVPKIRKHGIIPDFKISEHVHFVHAAAFSIILYDYRIIPDSATHPHSQQNPPDETFHIHLRDNFPKPVSDFLHLVQNPKILQIPTASYRKKCQRLDFGAN